jgi:hypothetical protein
MLTISCCTPKPHDDSAKFRIPKRLARVRRVFETKRMDSFKDLHEKIVKTVNEEKEFLKNLCDKQKLSFEFDLDEE